MPDDEEAQSPNSESEVTATSDTQESQSPPQPSPPQPSPPNVDRTELVRTARAFLNSPQVRYEGIAAKRDFLVQKGLNDAEIDELLREAPPQAPLIPPRTYPPPPQSNLPNLLVGILRLATWVAGGSVAILLAYFRFIHPRIAQSYQARHAIRTHQKDLLKRLTTSIEEVKVEQDATFAVLPEPRPYKEDEMYQDYKSLDDIVTSAKDPKQVPHITLLRCAIQGLAATNVKATTEAIFQHLEEKLPWTRSEEDPEVTTRLWEKLSSCPLFEEAEDGDEKLWLYIPPPTPPPAPLVSSLSSLRSALPQTPLPTSRYQNTLQTLTDFTGYIASETYAAPTNFRYNAAGMGSNLSPEEEDVRREIRALKGLVLNRRSFMPPRPPISSAAKSSTP